MKNVIMQTEHSSTGDGIASVLWLERFDLFEVLE